MSLQERIESGSIYVEYGHTNPEDRALQYELEKQRVRAKDLAFAYNRIKPSNARRKEKTLRKLFAAVGLSPFIESPLHCSYGCNTYIGNRFYSNFNLVIVDDGKVYIGDDVMCAPNVTIATTGHPLSPDYRRYGAQFSLPVKIGDGVWLGANVVVLPGVEIGANSVVGAGSVVTSDIPEYSLAMGVPCRVVRRITEEDRKWIRKNTPVNDDWRG